MHENKIAIIVDSSANLDEKTMRANNIYSIPLLISFDKTNEEIEDTPQNIKKSNFYLRVRNGEYTKTSQSSPGTLITLWRKLLADGYTQIVFFPIAKGLSGQYQNARMLAKEIEFKDRVFVIDTDGAATFNSSLALKASDISKSGGSVEDIKKMVKQVRKDSIIYIIPEDISRLSKGGRAKSVIVSLISLARIKLIIKFGEISQNGGIARTLNNAIEKVMTKIEEFINSSSNYTLEILVSECDDKVMKTVNEIIKKHPQLKIKKAFLPNVFVSHAGVNSIGIIIVKN